MSAEMVCVDGIEVELQVGPRRFLEYTTLEGLRGYIEARLVHRLEAFRPEPKRQALTRIFYIVGGAGNMIDAKEPVEELAAALERILGEAS